MNESSIDVQPYQANGFKRAEVLGAGNIQSTPIEPGNIKITANVQMNFGI